MGHCELVMCSGVKLTRDGVVMVNVHCHLACVYNCRVCDMMGDLRVIPERVS